MSRDTLSMRSLVYTFSFYWNFTSLFHCFAMKFDELSCQDNETQRVDNAV